MRRASARLDIVGRYNTEGVGGALQKAKKDAGRRCLLTSFYTANGQNRNFTSIPITRSARLAYF